MQRHKMFDWSCLFTWALVFETASSEVSDHLFSMTHLPKAQIPWKYELLLKPTLLLSHLHPHNAACPHTHTRTHASMLARAHSLHMHARTPTKTRTCRLCVEANVVHACLVELSYAERIFDLSQAAYQLLRYLHLVSWVCCLLGPSPASDAGYRGSQREIPTHSCLQKLVLKVCVILCMHQCVLL